MSGRKSTEVSGLLSNGEKTRKVSNEKLKQIIIECERSIKNDSGTYNETKNNILANKTDFSSDALNEFKEETGNIKKQLDSITKGIVDFNFNLNNINEQNAQLDNQLANLDVQTKNLYSAVRNKNDYCDKEYAQAAVIKGEYEQISRTKNQLGENAKTTKSNATIFTNNISSLSKQHSNLISEIEKINKKAASIVQIRQQVSEIKSFVSDAINEINKEDANKFMDLKWSSLLSSVEKFNGFGDSEIISSFDTLEQEISVFKSELLDKKNAFEKEKSETLSLINETEKLLTIDKFYDPIDYLQNENDANSFDLKEFLQTYMSNEYVSEISGEIEKANQYYKNEAFSDSKKIVGDVRKLINKTISYANIKQENMLKNVKLSMDIRNVMMDLNYKADTTIIGGNVSNGFKITCSVGEEIIDFDKIYVDDDGNPIVDIDHTESFNGSCNVKWENLQKEFINNGIFLNDVKKNGHSVIRKSTSQTTEVNQQNRSTQ